jgi:CheY-like chemotaxis protein
MRETVTLLRAELAHAGRTLVGHTTVLTPDTAFVRIDEEIAPGTSVGLVVSLRGALRPLRFRAEVTERNHPGGPGAPGGLWLAIDACSPADANSLRRLLDPPPAIRPLQILLVDDSSMTCDVFVHAAALAGSHALRLDAVTDAEQAWERLETSRYDLLVVDHFLTGSSGAHLITRVRFTPHTQPMPVLGLSVGGKVARDAMLAAGVDVFLDKPVRARELLATLKRLSGLVVKPAA